MRINQKISLAVVLLAILVVTAVGEPWSQHRIRHRLQGRP